MRAEIIGAAVGKKGEKPIFVSIGHKISLERAIDIVMNCTLRYRIPEPIRLAHAIANQEKNTLCKQFLKE